MRRPAFRRPNVRRAAGPWLPNGFTLANLGFGIYAIISASHGNFETAVRCIVFGGVCDLFDGAVARATRTGTQLGEQLDSLVDAISFGLAPAMIVYYRVLPQQGWGWLPVFIYVASAVFRLARFNVTQAGASKTYFIGLPSPAAGGTLATYYWFTQTRLYQETRIVDLPWQEIMPALMLLLAAMMSSTVPYPSWPKVGVRSWRGLAGLLGVLAIVVGGIFFSKYFFFLFGVGYLVWGLGRALLLALFEWPGDRPRRGDDDDDPDDPVDSYGMRDDEPPPDDDRLLGRRRRRRRKPALPPDSPT
ncbi:phosphatidylcholine/phosphatidylserine synthase [Roseisolibacter sp. H3M3-2]|uniref:CDP-alcohol phosphatidyltransferase family protein n=1 Tax=Roseisolibacter sp. H3M3-2 TaxID=3031323 RepID=UPI0023DB56C4|nr:phosphatidylcholine/phosphatidylserine synthase [Roseisolibacter sp. H3M3-2]MDF1501522.1 phosphatidylcholine/phosphatidylserine synthase [Roseisolibacter sp. H3M3-2]